MQFKEWLLSESQWVTLEKPVIINGVRCNQIDFRFEDYSRGSNVAPERSGTSPSPHPGLQFNRGSFSASMNDGRWVNVTEYESQTDPNMDYAMYRQMRAQGTLPPVPKPFSQVVISDYPFHGRKLPEDWFIYAALYLGRARSDAQPHLVKPPEYPRGNYEKFGRKDLLPKKSVQPERPIFIQ